MLKVQNHSKKIACRIALFAFLLLNSTLAFAQSRVTGTVVDSKGEALIGVSVLEVGTSNGASTDVDGKFSLNVSLGKTLRFTIVGYVSKDVKVSGSTLSVVLQDNDKLLEEVVVVGYGKMARKDLTSSITTIKAEELNKGGVYTSPGQLLQGKVPGLVVTTSSNPTSTPSVTLRGSSSLRSGDAQEPYYVIDGIPGASLALVAPDDIESIDVLRDASATAIYGSKAANGVIIVTTKKGKNGASNVTYSTYLAIDQVAKRWKVLNASEHRKLLSDNNITLASTNYIDENTDTDWQKEVQRTGISYNHNASITGGTEKTNYTASLNYLDNEGVIKKSKLDRTTVRMALNTKTLNERLDLGISLNASITNSKYFQSGDDGLSVLDAMTYYLPESPVYESGGTTYFENLNNNQYYNPVALLYQNSDDVRRKRLQGIGRASLQIIPKELTLAANFSYQTDNENISRYYDIASTVMQNYNGYALRSTNEEVQKNIEVYANYDKTFSSVHKFGAMLGYSWSENNTGDGFQTTDQGFTSDALGYYGLGTGSYSDGRIAYGSFSYATLRMISFFGRLNYSYNSKYLFQATVRRDGSSAFGTNNRWGTFPSASFAWRMNEEPFIKNLNVFSDLKFRVGYGVSGNSLGFDPYISMVLYGSSGTFINSSGETVTAIGATRNANPNLKWERTSMFNVGFDFGFFNNRLTGTIEYYNKPTKDLIADYDVSTTKYLVSWLTANVGKISNKGVELTLNATPVITKSFNWNTSLNLSHNDNKVVSLSNGEYTKDYFDKAELNAAGQTGSYQQRIQAGKPLGSFYTWKWAGYNADGVSLFYTADGGTTLTPSSTDRFWTGSAQPKLNIGWNNTFSYKNWSSTFFITSVLGNKILNASRASLSRMGSISYRNILKSALETEKATDYNSHYLSDRYIEKGDYVRLSSLSIAYNFKKFTSYIQNLRVYASCNNVFVITGYKGLDPEVNLGGTQPGIDNRDYYPKTRTFMFGTSITF